MSSNETTTIIIAGDQHEVPTDKLNELIEKAKPKLPDGAEMWFEFTGEESHIFLSRCNGKINVFIEFNGGPDVLKNSSPLDHPHLRLKPDLQKKVDEYARKHGYTSGFVSAFKPPSRGEVFIDNTFVVNDCVIDGWSPSKPRPIITLTGKREWGVPSRCMYEAVYPNPHVGTTSSNDRPCDLQLTFQPGTEFEQLKDGSLQVTVLAGQRIHQRVRKVGE